MKLFPEDLLYSQEHIWIRVEGNLATIGITDHAQEKLGEILSLDLPEADSYVERDEPFGRIESAKAAIELISPVSGIINSDPQDTGWMIVVEMDDPDELDDLLDTGGYQEFVTREEEIG
jgi:glycine cleavage system H protein